MDKELQDYIWSILPKEAKKRIKGYYQYTDCNTEAESILEKIFGEHNYKDECKTWNKDATIDGLVHSVDYQVWYFIIIVFTPIVNTMFGSVPIFMKLWDKVKDVKI